MDDVDFDLANLADMLICCLKNGRPTFVSAVSVNLSLAARLDEYFGETEAPRHLPMAEDVRTPVAIRLEHWMILWT